MFKWVGLGLTLLGGIAGILLFNSSNNVGGVIAAFIALIGILVLFKG